MSVPSPEVLRSAETRGTPVLLLQDVSVVFDGLHALNRLNLTLAENEVRCIIGPNGAGKTTMMDVVTGKTRPASGTVRLNLGSELDLRRLPPARIARAGIGRKFQKPTVFENHAVWENLELARQTRRRWYEDLFAPAHSQGRVEEMLEELQLAEERDRPAGLLAHGQKQRLEIGMLLMQEARILLLDEPAAGLSDAETAQLADLLRGLSGRCSLLVVEHDMEFVAAVAGATGTVTVMAEGSVLAEGTLENVKRDPAVIESYLGR